MVKINKLIKVVFVYMHLLYETMISNKCGLVFKKAYVQIQSLNLIGLVTKPVPEIDYNNKAAFCLGSGNY